MSKQSKKKARRRKASRKPVLHVLCQRCGTTSPATPEALLGAVAAALNACEDAGVKTRLRHGAVYSREGYVLQTGTRWEPRTLAYREFAPPAPAEDDGLDD